MSMGADDLSKLLPDAKQVMEQLALAEAEKASEAVRQKAKADAEKKALIDKLSKPSGVSEEDRLPLRTVGLLSSVFHTQSVSEFECPISLQRQCFRLLCARRPYFSGFVHGTARPVRDQRASGNLKPEQIREPTPCLCRQPTSGSSGPRPFQ